MKRTAELARSFFKTRHAVSGGDGRELFLRAKRTSHSIFILK